MELSIKFDWVAVPTRRPQQLYCFGTKRRLLTKDCQRAAVYRWIFHPLGTPPVCLVGSTEDLFRRTSEYQSHKSDHHQKVRESFEKHLSSGGTVVLETLRFDTFTFNGVEFSENKLVNPFIREALEKVCCADLELKGFRLLNSTLQRRYLRKLMSLQKSSPEAFEQVLRDMQKKVEAGQS
jgi:hypothetical protein